MPRPLNLCLRNVNKQHEERGQPPNEGHSGTRKSKWPVDGKLRGRHKGQGLRMARRENPPALRRRLAEIDLVALLHAQLRRDPSQNIAFLSDPVAETRCLPFVRTSSSNTCCLLFRIHDFFPPVEIAAL